MTEQDALNIVTSSTPGVVTPLPGNPSIIGWYLFNVTFRGGTSIVAIDNNGNLWEREDEAWVQGNPPATMTEQEHNAFPKGRW